MLVKALVSLVVWVVVALVLGLFGSLLVKVATPITIDVGHFLSDGAIIIGFVAGLCYFVWGSPPANLRPRV